MTALTNERRSIGTLADNAKNLFRVLVTFVFWAANGFMGLWMFMALSDEANVSAASTVITLAILLPMWAAVMVITGGFYLLARKTCKVTTA